jgi:UDP:flavonoid glycosyltransferase YjiC (YdhE family)
VGGETGKDELAGSPLCAHISYIDFEYALPKARAIIHHGGIGTTAQAIKAGIPQLIRPIKYDQPDNANRIAKLGLGAYVLPEFFTAETVAPLLSSLIDRASNNQALKNYSADVRASNAIAEACSLIEQRIGETQCVKKQRK